MRLWGFMGSRGSTVRAKVRLSFVSILLKIEFEKP